LKRKSQNLIEFVIVIPLLLIVLFGIIEYAVFWRNAQTVQTIALEAASTAATVIVNDDQTETFGPFFNQAALKAFTVVRTRVKDLGLPDLGFTITNPNGFGKRPYAVYELTSQQTRSVTDESGNQQTLPIIRFIFDYRDPYKRGIVTQLVYQYKTLFLGVEFNLPGGHLIKIIPRDIEISSTKIQQYNQF